MNYPRPRGTADLEERTGKNAEDFLDEKYIRRDDDDDEDQEEEE